MASAGSVPSLGEIKNKDAAHTYDPATDSLEALRDYIATQIAALPDLITPRPSIYLIETWQPEEWGINPAVWAITNPATGSAWGIGASGAYIRARAVPNANETARIRSIDRWYAAPGVYSPHNIYRKLNLEFELRLANVLNLDNTLCFFGLTSGGTATRATDNIIGWCLAADVLASLSDNAGAEEANTGFGETLTDMNKLKMVFSSGSVAFYLNEVLVATHITNIPDQPMFLNWFIDTEAFGAGTIELGIIRCWPEDIA